MHAYVYTRVCEYDICVSFPKTWKQTWSVVWQYVATCPAGVVCSLVSRNLSSMAGIVIAGGGAPGHSGWRHVQYWQHWQLQVEGDDSPGPARGQLQGVPVQKVAVNLKEGQLPKAQLRACLFRLLLFDRQGRGWRASTCARPGGAGKQMHHVVYCFKFYQRTFSAADLGNFKR